MKILITGDLVVNKDYGSSLIDDKVIKLFKNSDLNIANLECPISDKQTNDKIIKTGPHLKGNKSALKDVARALNIGLVTLANNHVMDYGKGGLEETLRFCQENNISTVGAGTNRPETKMPFRTEISGAKVSIINFTENEWSTSFDDCGANPMDIIDNLQDIRREKMYNDYVIVIIHGGHEYYNLPSPRMQKQYRFYAENGADLIVGHHPHCIGGYEEHQGVPIYYSLGNFLFTKASKYDDWYLGIVLEITTNSTGKIKAFPHLVKQDRSTYALSQLSPEEDAVARGRIREYSLIIETNLQDYWKTYLEKSYPKYKKYWSPLSYIKNAYLREALYRIVDLSSSRRGNALFLNLIRCESHSDISKETLKRKLTK